MFLIKWSGYKINVIFLKCAFFLEGSYVNVISRDPLFKPCETFGCSKTTDVSLFIYRSACNCLQAVLCLGNINLYFVQVAENNVFYFCIEHWIFEIFEEYINKAVWVYSLRWRTIPFSDDLNEILKTDKRISLSSMISPFYIRLYFANCIYILFIF